MPTPWIHRELHRFDPEAPLAEARTPPASWYHHPELARLEQAGVWARSWIPVGRLEEVAEPGSYLAGCFAGVPWVVTRDARGALRAFRNTCRHRATTLVRGAGRSEELVCGYHGWRYALDGRLTRAPELGAAQGFRRQEHGLLPLPVTTWSRFLLISFGGEAPAAPDEALGDLATRLAASGAEELTFLEQRRYSLACNWKVYVDNYLDGGYHVAHLHRGLGAQLDLASYRTEIHARHSVQACAGAGEAARDEGADFAARVGAEAFYAWLYPAFMINRYGPFMDTNLVIPKGPDRCEVVFDYFVDPDAECADEEFLERSLAASHAVQLEDIEICERVQEGLASGSFDTGVYSVRREAGEHHFHRLLAADLRAAAEGEAPAGAA